jgi:oligopeptide/dipeptide ABC transporter ATP-binding protein
MNMVTQDAAPLLSVKNLRTVFLTRHGSVAAVDDVNIDIGRGEILALLGESGCGKSVTALSLMGLIPARLGHVESGRVEFAGRDLTQLGPDALRRLRGGDMAMIFQEPMSSLNPVLTVGRQVAEAMLCHAKATEAGVRERVVQLFREVGITEPARRYDSYPHELSGGMCQRIMIAMALSCDPQLLIADEPTTALDVTVQQQILDLLHDLRERRNMAMLLITHDLGVVAENADRVAVMYLGKVVEQAPVHELFAGPAHPYTEGLLAAMPELDSGSGPLPSIPGTVPDLTARPAGCGFAPRCGYADARCHSTPPDLTQLTATRSVRCWKPLALAAPLTAPTP